MLFGRNNRAIRFSSELAAHCNGVCTEIRSHDSDIDWTLIGHRLGLGLVAYLRVEGRVLNKGVDKHHEVVLDLERLHVGGLVLLVNVRHQLRRNLVRYVVHVRAAAQRTDAVHVAHLPQGGF